VLLAYHFNGFETTCLSLRLLWEIRRKQRKESWREGEEEKYKGIPHFFGRIFLKGVDENTLLCKIFFYILKVF